MSSYWGCTLGWLSPPARVVLSGGSKVGSRMAPATRAAKEPNSVLPAGGRCVWMGAWKKGWGKGESRVE
jgi:hypothetical protein